MNTSKTKIIALFVSFASFGFAAVACAPDKEAAPPSGSAGVSGADASTAVTVPDSGASGSTGGASVDAGDSAASPGDASRPTDATTGPTTDVRDAAPNPTVDATPSPTTDARDTGRDEQAMRPEAGPNPYQGTAPVAGTPVPLGNTRIFDDSTGVVWNPSAGELLFSVDQINHVWRWRPEVTTNMGFDIVRRGGENVFGIRGLAMTPDHALIACETGGHRVTRSFPGYDTPVTLAERAPGGRFNSPFDVVARDDGNVYFTDPVLGAGKSPDLDFEGIYRVDPAGKVSLVARDLEPWALALSADHDTLFVSTGSHKDARAGGIYKFPILADGSLGPRTLFASGGAAGPPGGLCVDKAGNVYHAFFAVNVLGPDGTKRAKIEVPGATDCAFGGADQKTLFVTAGSGPAVYNLWAVPLNVPGVP